MRTLAHRTILLLLLFGMPAVSPASSFFGCATDLWQKSTLSIRPYLREVKSTRGRRLILKKSDVDYLTRLKYGGFLVEVRVKSRRLSSIFLERPLTLFGLRGHRLAPIGGIYHQFVRKPIWRITDRILGQQLEPAFFVRVPAAIMLSMIVYQNADALYDRKLEEHIQYTVDQNRNFYDDLIRSDYRYHQVREELAGGKIDRMTGRNRAYWIYLAYSKYFEFESTQPQHPDLESELHFLNNLLFAHLKPVIENGVKPTIGFFISPKSLGPLSDDQKRRLFDLNRRLFLDYELVAEAIHGSPVYDQVRKLPGLVATLKLILDDPFAKKLIEMRNQGLISAQDLQYLLQQNLFWETRFAEWRTIGVTRLKVDSQGKLTNQPLTLEEVQDEILSDQRNSIQ